MLVLLLSSTAQSRTYVTKCIILWIIIGSDRRPETKQGKIVRFRSGSVRDRVRFRVRVRDSDRRSEPNTVLIL